MTSGQKIILSVIFKDRIHYRFLILLLSLLATVLGLALPYYQKVFTIQLDYVSIGICVFISLCYLAFNQLTLFIGQNESLHAQRKLADLVYRQNLQLKPHTLQEKTVGEVAALYSTDIPSIAVWLEQSLPYGLTTLFPLVLTPVFLFYFYDLPYSFSSLVVLFLVIINGIMAFRQSIFFFRFKKLAADRMGLVNEWIQNIRGLKILNWIEAFEVKILKKRREETQNRISMVKNGQFMNAVSSSVMFWLNVTLVGFLIWFYDKPFSKADIISLLWVTTVFLSRPLRQLPWFFTFVFDAWTSFRRLSEFLDLKNVDPRILKVSNTDAVLKVRSLNLTLGTTQVLKDISFDVQPGEMIALIGPVGAGKSLLIKSLIEETPFVAEEIFVSDVTYLPQEHFIMSATLRDNMNFNYRSDKSNDSGILKSLSQAQFSFETDRVEHGLETVIGERGLNLSGGQKQRVSLGRQFLTSKKLLLLDDPLSAVDVATEKKLIDEFVQLKNAGVSILLTTQRFSALPYCDRILFLSHGRVEYFGTASEFLRRSEYQSFLKGLI